jgi:hypothetical protein
MSEHVSSCGLCRRGWVGFWPRENPPYTADRLMVGLAVDVPCRCNLGRNMGPDKHGNKPVPVPDSVWRVIQKQHAAWSGAVTTHKTVDEWEP